MPDAPNLAPSECPRCGYDLTGVVETWTESCPVNGTCSECGLEFDWADVLRVDRRRLAWLFEHAQHWWSVRAFVITGVLALIPWVFWNRVRLHHEVRLRRIAIFHMLLLIPGILAWGIWTFESARIAPRWMQANGAIGSYPSLTEIAFKLFSPIVLWDPTTAGAIAFSGGFIVSLILARAARARTAVRPRIIMRACLYSLVGTALIVSSEFVFQSAAHIQSSHAVTSYQAIVIANPGVRPIFPSVTIYNAWIEYSISIRDGVILANAVWLLVYWPCAIKRGMRLSEAWQIITVGVVLAVLMALAAIDTVENYPYLLLP